MNLFLNIGRYMVNSETCMIFVAKKKKLSGTYGEKIILIN